MSVWVGQDSIALTNNHRRVVTVSLETMKIVKSLPRLDVQSPGPTVGRLMEPKDAPDALTA